MCQIGCCIYDCIGLTDNFIFVITSAIYIDLLLLGAKNHFALTKFSLYKFRYIPVSLMEVNGHLAGPANHFELRYHFVIS